MFAWMLIVELNHSWAWKKLIEKERVVGKQTTLSVTTDCFPHLLWLLTQNGHKQPLRYCLEREKSNVKPVQSKQIKLYLKWAITKMYSCCSDPQCTLGQFAAKCNAVGVMRKRTLEFVQWCSVDCPYWSESKLLPRYEMEFSSFGICSGLCLHWCRHCISLLWCRGSWV